MGGRHTECARCTDAHLEWQPGTPNDPAIAHDTIEAVIAVNTLDEHHSLRLTWKTSPVLAICRDPPRGLPPFAVLLRDPLPT